MIKFSLTLESFTLTTTGDDTIINDGDTVIGKISKITDDKGTYFKGTLSVNKHYEGVKATDNELSLTSAKVKMKALYKKYKVSLNVPLGNIQDEYNELLTKLTDVQKKIVNDFLKKLNSEDTVALKKTVAFIKANFQD
jgi:hypothetical protein